MELRNELDLVLRQEESLWFQRSRCLWLSNGNMNTMFYHQATMTRRRRKVISGLKGDGGEWGTELQSLECLVTEFYHNLFTSEGPSIAQWEECRPFF
ncbi:hypothetical protein V6N13_043025 [Hibiscus sabdariffa]